MAPPRTVSVAGFRAAAGALLDHDARLALVAAHHDPDGIRVVHTYLSAGAPPTEIQTTVPHEADGLPTIADLSYPAGRFEREIRDLYGLTPIAHPLPRRLVRHEHWPVGYYPMRADATADPQFADDSGSFAFMEVTGDGVYEIPVGPVHAGLIEPGHFRFSVVGETILRMKARLWFVHRGVERLFQGCAPAAGVDLAERISGDTAVGHSLAYVLAVEQALGIACSPRDTLLRSLLLELERVHNHVADIGAIINDVGYGVLHAQSQVQRERLLRHHRELTGHRLLRGAITPGRTTLRRLPDGGLLADVAAQAAQIVDIAVGNHIAADRLTGTSVLPTSEARRLGVLGYVAKASGISVDARRDHPLIGDDDAVRPFEPVVLTNGDVMARLQVRLLETHQSVELIANLAAAAQHARQQTGAVEPDPAGRGLGIVEAWRGTLVHRVEVQDGRVSRCKVVDPSFFNWPALPVALRDTIVPDFPLTNKSFNQSYAGNDL
ncbi:MAG: nickel-dependent hydrogenase large subunit [Austwickia sp.]|nr:nickel-dependent hydrogenase large subunit [Austwickia sp.]MBK9102684.1 nickel-dependent hydrogenase large subunit [Austwickia sp.]